MKPQPNKENASPDIVEISYKDIWNWVVGDGPKPEAFDVPEDETNYDLNKIPLEEWADYELKNLYVPPDCPTDDLNELVWWLERYYDFEGRNFNGYITIDCLIEDGPIVFAPDKPSRIVFYAGRPAGLDQLAREIYARWQAEDLADRPGYTECDAHYKAWESHT